MSGPHIALISPRGPLYRHNGGIWKKSLRYAPLTLTTLAALIPDELNAEVTLVDEGIEIVDTDLDADLVGITAITGTAPRAYNIADAFRSRDVPVVLGGVHPTLRPEEAMAHADSVVTGYAEDTWPQLLRDFTNGGMQRRYDQDPDLDLAGTPRPRRDLLPDGRFTTSHTIEATRGCPHRCEFCVVPSAWGAPMQRPIEEVIDDIRQMNPDTLVFLDLNLLGDTDYAKELFRAMIPLDLKWGGLATTLIAQDDELIDLAARSGCAGLLIGLESLNPDSLAETRKQFNSLEKYRTVVDRLHEVGIAIMGCFVFGFDNDTPAVFEETVSFVNEVGIDLPRYAVLTPFPGTPLFRRLKDQGRIRTEDWTLYDGQHVVYEPKGMSPQTLQEGTQQAWQDTYKFSSIARRLFQSRTRPMLSVASNLGYRFYANRLERYYTCREPV